MICTSPSILVGRAICCGLHATDPDQLCQRLSGKGAIVISPLFPVYKLALSKPVRNCLLDEQKGISYHLFAPQCSQQHSMASSVQAPTGRAFHFLNAA